MEAKIVQIGEGEAPLDARSPSIKDKEGSTLHRFCTSIYFWANAFKLSNGPGKWGKLILNKQPLLLPPRSLGVGAQPWDSLGPFREFWRSPGALGHIIDGWGSFGKELRYHHVKGLRRRSQHQAQRSWSSEEKLMGSLWQWTWILTLARSKYLPLIKGSKLFSSGLAMDHSGGKSWGETGLSYLHCECQGDSSRERATIQ